MGSMNKTNIFLSLFLMALDVAVGDSRSHHKVAAIGGNSSFECTAIAESTAKNLTLAWEYKNMSRSLKNWTVAVRIHASGSIEIVTPEFKGRIEVKSGGRQLTIRRLIMQVGMRIRCNVDDGTKTNKKTSYNLQIIQCPAPASTAAQKETTVDYKGQENPSSTPLTLPVFLEEENTTVGIFCPERDAHIDCLAQTTVSPRDVQMITWNRELHEHTSREFVAGLELNSTKPPQTRRKYRNRINISKNGSLHIMCLRPGEVFNLMCELKKKAMPGETPQRIHFKIFVTRNPRDGILLKLSKGAA